MKFLDQSYVWDWCRRHGYMLDEGEAGVAPRLAVNHSRRTEARQVHSAAADPAAAAKLARELLGELRDWNSCLAWVTDADVWQNEEDWPRYYAWRARFGERRSLGAAPGHQFTIDDRGELEFLLTHALECGWDMSVLPESRARPTGRQLFVSHDEWFALELSQASTSAQVDQCKP